MVDSDKSYDDDQNSDSLPKPTDGGDTAGEGVRRRGRPRRDSESMLDEEELNAEESPLCLDYLNCCGLRRCTDNTFCQNTLGRLTLAPLTVIAAVLGFVIGIALQSARPDPKNDFTIDITNSSPFIAASIEMSVVQAKATLNTIADIGYDITDSASASTGSIQPLAEGDTSGCDLNDNEPCLREWEIVLSQSDCEVDGLHEFAFTTVNATMEECSFYPYEASSGAMCPLSLDLLVDFQSTVECETGFDIFVEILKYPGDLFIRALKLMVLPLIIATMMAVPSRLGDAAGATRLGTRTIMYYVVTSVFGACEGLIWVNIFNPGKGVDCETCLLDDDLASEDKSVLDAFLDLGFSAIDKNLVDAYSATNILGLVCFSFAFGYFLMKHPHKKLMLDFVIVVQDVSMMIINVIIKFTPIGMFSLVSGQVAQMEGILGVLEALGMFVACAFTAMIIHVLLVYPLMYFLLTRQNPYAYYARIIPAPMTALATSSSAATMPVTLRVNKLAGVSDRTANFTIPLGTTINMDGTAIGYPIAVIFLAQLILPYDLTAGEQIVVAILATVISIGAAPVPSAGMVYLIVILEAVNIPVGGAIAFLFTVDWFVDRLETCVNVFGDSIGAAIIDFYEQKELGGLNSVKEEEEMDTLDGDDDGQV